MTFVNAHILTGFIICADQPKLVCAMIKQRFPAGASPTGQSTAICYGAILGVRLDRRLVAAKRPSDERRDATLSGSEATNENGAILSDVGHRHLDILARHGVHEGIVLRRALTCVARCLHRHSNVNIPDGASSFA